MYAANEVFLASTTMWTYPLIEVEGRPVGGGKPGTAVRLLREALLEEFHGAKV
jgi:branched-subunit amino acid aminotransferase/4-amino-4-deoxychorismate lyase